MTSHVSAQCDVGTNPYGVYAATGDFQPSNDVANQQQLFLFNVGMPLDDLPQQSRMLVLDVHDQTGNEWRGLGPVPGAGNVDLLLFPATAACALSTNVGDALARSAGMIDATLVLSTGGTPSGNQPPSFVTDLSTGRARELALGPQTSRVSATVTSFANGALLAGGYRSDAPTVIVDRAEFYDSALRDFDGKPFSITPRARHGAIALANGQTLLVGGVGEGANSVELVDPIQKRVSSANTPILAPRVDPIVFRLSTGEVFVGGGSNPDGTPRLDIDLLSGDGHARLETDLTIPARTHMSMVPLDGGGALIVIAPDPSDTTDFLNTWILSAARTITPAATQIQNAILSSPKLFRGATSSPVLWTGSVWLIWDPWRETFDALGDALGAPGPSLTSATISPDPGLLAWITEDGTFFGRRFSVRHAFTTDLFSFLTNGTIGMVPDRAPILGQMSFDSTLGLALPAETTAFVGDARFHEATIDVDATSGALPTFVLRDESGNEVTVGSFDCPWPIVSLPAQLHVDVRADSIHYGVKNNPALPSLQSCAKTPSDRFAIGLRGTPSTVRNLRVSR